MIVVDAGASNMKTCLIEQGKIGAVNLYPGLSPNYNTDDEIISVLSKALIGIQKNTQIFFYGTGCAIERNKGKMQNLITDNFGLAQIEVHSDLLAAARATAGIEEGQINILGTGSASCIYNGKNIQSILPNHGFLFGDFGSGYKLGYGLLQMYFDSKFGKEANEIIESFAGVNSKDMISFIYTKDTKSKISNFAKCVYTLRELPQIKQLISSEFEQFVKRQIMSNPGYHHISQYFVGSIAYHFKMELMTTLQLHGIEINKIVQSPIEELCRFHLTYTQ